MEIPHPRSFFWSTKWCRHCSGQRGRFVPTKHSIFNALASTLFASLNCRGQSCEGGRLAGWNTEQEAVKEVRLCVDWTLSQCPMTVHRLAHGNSASKK